MTAISDADARSLNALLQGGPAEDAAIELMSPDLQKIARHVVASDRNATTRIEALDEALDGRLDGDELRRAIFTTDPFESSPPSRQAGRRCLAWRTAAEVAVSESEEPDWIVGHYAALKSITEFEGKIKVGKTTVLARIFSLSSPSVKDPLKQYLRLVRSLHAGSQ